MSRTYEANKESEERRARFTAEADIADGGRPVIKFRQYGIIYSKSYDCCWRHTHNCNRTWIASYCRALDSEVP